MLKLLAVLVFAPIALADIRHLFDPYQAPGAEIAILKSDFNTNPDGSYQYAYETANGIAAQQQGQQKHTADGIGNVAQGAFQYLSPEGVAVAVQYIADENGYQPQSDSIPTTPPVPSAIVKAIEWNARHPEQ